MNHDYIIIIIIIPICPAGRICALDQCFSTKTLYAYPNASNHTTHAKNCASFI